MRNFSRRSFLAASAAFAAAPAFAAVPGANVDVVVIGAGAAGIAAARRLAAAGRRVALVEASDRIGGRCVTDTRTFGVPFDLGAHWIRMPDVNPVAKLAAQAKLDVYPAPTGQRLRIGRRNAREGELEEFLSAQVRAARAIGEAARGKADVSCAQALPKDLGDWRPAIEFLLGPFACGKDLNEVSAVDFAQSVERDADAFCRQGFGTLVAKLAEGLPLALSSPVTRIDFSGRGEVEVETAKGQFRARAAIVTVSTNVLAAGNIRFKPLLGKRVLDALSKLTLGSYDHIALMLDGNPFGLQSDDLVFEKASGNRTAALLANVSGTSLCLVEVGGRFGRSLAAEGEAAMVAFAADWLADLYGADIRNAITRRRATQWNKEPFVLGAVSVAAPGNQGARRVLAEPLANRVWFAGEAVHETLWGTVGGAWDSGERVADAVLKRYWPPETRPRKR